MQGGEERGKRFLYERIWRASSFVPERTACTCPILVLYSLSSCISISSHREIFSRANDLVLHFFFFLSHTPVLHSFLSPFAKNTSSASGTTFNRGPNCVAHKSARANQQSAVAKCGRVHSLYREKTEKTESGRLEFLAFCVARMDAHYANTSLDRNVTFCGILNLHCIIQTF